MRGFKIVFGLCLLFLLGTSIYFLFIDGYAEANVSTYRGLAKGSRLDGWGILYMFVMLAGMYIFTIREHKRRDKRTKYKK